MKPWLLAVGVSLVVHSALFIALPPLTPAPLKEQAAQRGDQFITFTAVTSPPPPGELSPSPRGGEGRGEGCRGSSCGRSPRPALTATSPVDRPAPSGVNGGGPELAEGPPAQVEGAPEAEEPGGEGASALTPSLSPVGESEADVTALVHDRLAAMADRCYPSAARRFQQRGTVQLSFCTDANGAAASTSITQSSGAELLDAAARGCVVESAVPFPHQAASRCFSVPVRFGAARP